MTGLVNQLTKIHHGKATIDGKVVHFSLHINPFKVYPLVEKALSKTKKSVSLGNDFAVVKIEKGDDPEWT